MNLLRIDCKEENGGYMHSVFDKVNGKMHIIASCKFASVMNDPADIKDFTNDPHAFMALVAGEPGNDDTNSN